MRQLHEPDITRSHPDESGEDKPGALLSAKITDNSQEGDRFFRLPEVYIRGNNIKYLRVPEDTLDKVRERERADYQARNRGGFGQNGRGRGRGGNPRGKVARSRGITKETHRAQEAALAEVVVVVEVEVIASRIWRWRVIYIVVAGLMATASIQQNTKNGDPFATCIYKSGGICESLSGTRWPDDLEIVDWCLSVVLMYRVCGHCSSRLRDHATLARVSSTKTLIRGMRNHVSWHHTPCTFKLQMTSNLTAYNDTNIIYHTHQTKH